jgi:hypothetical protein
VPAIYLGGTGLLTAADIYERPVVSSLSLLSIAIGVPVNFVRAPPPGAAATPRDPTAFHPTTGVHLMLTIVARPSRRGFLGALALGASAFTARGAFADELERTPRIQEGPFYPIRSTWHAAS